MNRQWVLLRGLVREQGHWGEFLEKFKAADPGSEVLPIDFPGVGVYNRLSSPTNVDGIGEFVHSHFKNPRPKERFLITMSLGGMVGTAIAKLHPESIDGMLIINSSFRNLSPFYHRLQPDGMIQFYKAATAKTPEERELAILDMVSNRTDKDKIVARWAEISRMRPVTPLNLGRQLFAAAKYDLPEEKPSIPMMVLNSEGDHMVNPQCSQKLAEKWQLPIATHPSGGHELCLDEPEWVISQAKSFFKVT